MPGVLPQPKIRPSARRFEQASLISSAFAFFDDFPMCDEEGRPLSEQPEDAPDAEFRYVISRFDDERRGKPFNQSALKQASSHLDAAVATIRQYSAALSQIQGWMAGDIRLLWGASLIARWRVFFDLQTSTPNVNASDAVANKASRGLCDLCVHFMLASDDSSSEVDAKQLLRFAHENHLLATDAGACAAPDPMIALFCRAGLGLDPLVTLGDLSMTALAAQYADVMWRLEIACATACLTGLLVEDDAPAWRQRASQLGMTSPLFERTVSRGAREFARIDVCLEVLQFTAWPQVDGRVCNFVHDRRGQDHLDAQLGKLAAEGRDILQRAVSQI